MTVISDEEFDREVEGDPINKALNDFLTATGAGAVVAIAVCADHRIAIVNFGNGEICSCQDAMLKMAHKALRHLAAMSGGQVDADLSKNVESISSHTPVGKRH